MANRRCALLKGRGCCKTGLRAAGVTKLLAIGSGTVLRDSMRIAPQEIRTFFVTSNTQGRRSILQSVRMAELFLAVLADNRTRGRFLLHEFVVMPDHFHLLITPAEDIPLEKAVQYVKGGFSFRAKRELGFNGEIWQEGFANHRVRDADDYERHRNYIRHNPVARFLARAPELYPYSSASAKIETDPVPPWLKPAL